MSSRGTLTPGIALVALTSFFLAGCASEQPEPAAIEDSSDAASQVDESVEADQDMVSPEAGESSPPVNSYTLEDVATHNTLDDCWIAVDGVVYDVSGFGPSHPGGASRIEQICGTDATDAFRGQHGSSGAPNSTLAGFEIGMLQ